MTAFYNEYDPKAAAWLRELIRRGLIADGVVDERSILDVQPDDLRGFTQVHCFAGVGGWSLALRMAGWPDDRPVWTGSPPCQPFSAAGRQKGKDDERHLAPHFAALVAECRPAVLFGEQVASAAVFGKAASGARKAADDQAPLEWAWLDDLFERLEAAHYACGASDIPAAGVGAAHIRQRTFFGAQRLDDPASPRHDGPFAGPEGLARNETWLRLSGSGSGHGGLADAPRQQHDRPRNGGAGRGLEHPDGRADGRLADGNDTGSQGRPGVPERAGERLAGARGMGGGLAHSLHAGRPEWRPLAGDGSVAGGSGGLCGLADANSGQRGRVANGEGRLGHRAATGRLQGDGEPERGGERGGLVYADRAGQQAERSGAVGLWPEHETVLRGPTGEWPDASDLGWSSADWLFCRDGKWRPVEARAQPLVDGLPAGMGRVRDPRAPETEEAIAFYAEITQTRPAEVLRDLCLALATEAGREREAGGYGHVSEASLLLAFVCQLAAQGWPLAESLPLSRPQEPPRGMRMLWDHEAAASASHQRGLDGQQSREPSDLVHILSPVLARDAHSAWGEALAADAEIGFPLGANSQARVARLRGYGNAIVPQAAAEFVKAFDAAAAECFRLNDLSRITTDNEGVFG